jgi:hypothetical protein
MAGAACEADSAVDVMVLQETCAWLWCPSVVCDRVLSLREHRLGGNEPRLRA